MSTQSTSALERLLKTAEREMSRQRTALLRQDLAELRRSVDVMAALVVQCHEVSATAPATSETAALTRLLRDQLRLNQGLIRNGSIAVDQWVNTVAAAAPVSGGSVLFSEVG